MEIEILNISGTHLCHEGSGQVPHVASPRNTGRWADLHYYTSDKPQGVSAAWLIPTQPNCSCLTLSQVTQAGGAKPGKNRLQQLHSQRLVLFNKGQGSPELKWGGSPYAGFEVSSWWQSHLCLPLRDDTARVGSPPVCPQLWWWAPSAVLGMASPGTEGREYQGKQGSVWPAAVQF